LKISIRTTNAAVERIDCFIICFVLNVNEMTH
jgi:hypothetical protein